MSVSVHGEGGVYGFEKPKEIAVRREPSGLARDVAQCGVPCPAAFADTATFGSGPNQLVCPVSTQRSYFGTVPFMGSTGTSASARARQGREKR